MTLRAVVLIPAYNEAAVIARTLLPLRALADARVIKLVIVANACADDTAMIARQACPSACVIETPIAGKTLALNLGVAQAMGDVPLVCMDADLGITAKALLALIDALEGGALAAIGQMQVKVDAASALVRAYQRAWSHNPYFAQGKFGGLFALAPKAVKTLFPLPELTADDEFLRRSIAPCDVVYVPTCSFVAQSPRTLASLFATRKRALRGARQLGRLGLKSPHKGSFAAMLKAYAKRPAQWGDLAVFIVMGAALRLALAFEAPRKSNQWERDLTNRMTEMAP